MDASGFSHLIETDHYSPADLEQVNDLCRNYPMFNLAQMLKVRIRESLGYDKEQELKMAAIYAADRRKLFQMVTEVSRPEEIEEEPLTEEAEGILFSDEPHHEADVIIEQHAPYASLEPAGDLLELDEEELAGDFVLVEEGEDAGEEHPTITEADLIESMAKDEVDMEEPMTEEMETPSMEVVESVVDAESENKQETGSIPEPESEAGPRSNDRLILSFIKDEPGPLRAEKSTASKRDVSLASIREHDGFITDTLAKIYVKQGLYAKAIYAYEKLSLKYPEKSAYFAAQIEKIRNINHS